VQNKVKRKNRESKQDYTRFSSHEEIRGKKTFFFALRITRANMDLKINLQRASASPLKMKLFLINQMLQHNNKIK
jgi:hypothetical protein